MGKLRYESDIAYDIEIMRIHNNYPMEDCKQLLRDIKALVKSEREYLAHLITLYSTGPSKGSESIHRLDTNILEHEDWLRLLTSKVKQLPCVK